MHTFDICILIIHKIMIFKLICIWFLITRHIININDIIKYPYWVILGEVTYYNLHRLLCILGFGITSTRNIN